MAQAGQRASHVGCNPHLVSCGLQLLNGHHSDHFSLGLRGFCRCKRAEICQTPAALQRRNTSCILSDATATRGKEKQRTCGVFWRVTFFSEFGHLHILRQPGRAKCSSFSYKALHYKRKSGTKSRTVLLIKQSRIFTQTEPAAQNTSGDIVCKTATA